jgi:hypothetical protein
MSLGIGADRNDSTNTFINTLVETPHLPGKQRKNRISSVGSHNSLYAKTTKKWNKHRMCLGCAMNDAFITSRYFIGYDLAHFVCIQQNKEWIGEISDRRTKYRDLPDRRIYSVTDILTQDSNIFVDRNTSNDVM